MKIYLATPVYSGDLCHEYVEALWASRTLCQAEGVQIVPMFWAGNCYVEQARSLLITDFIKSDCDKFVFIDSDLSWDPQAFLRLCKSEKKVIAGCYPFKVDSIGFPVGIQTDENDYPLTEGSLIKGVYVPTGFLFLDRSVVNEFLEKKPEWWVKSYNADGTMKDEYFAMFRCEYEGDRYWGEDFNFCKHYIRMGGSIFIDPEITFLHVGRKQWAGHFGNYLRSQPK